MHIVQLAVLAVQFLFVLRSLFFNAVSTPLVSLVIPWPLPVRRRSSLILWVVMMVEGGGRRVAVRRRRMRRMVIV